MYNENKNNAWNNFVYDQCWSENEVSKIVVVYLVTFESILWYTY